VRAEDLERAKEALSEQQDAGEANGEDG
jgi:hypothetical protein